MFPLESLKTDKHQYKIIRKINNVKIIITINT